MSPQVLYPTTQTHYLNSQMLYLRAQTPYLSPQILYLTTQTHYLNSQMLYLRAQTPYLSPQILYLTTQTHYLTTQTHYLNLQMLYLRAQTPYMSPQILYLQPNQSGSGPYRVSILHCYAYPIGSPTMGAIKGLPDTQSGSITNPGGPQNVFGHTIGQLHGLTQHYIAVSALW